MYIKEIHIKDFRAFSDTKLPLGSSITCLSGHNGVGKSTVLALLSNCGELKAKEGKHLNGDLFRGEYSTLIKEDERFDTTGEKCTILFSDLPEFPSTDNPYIEKLDFRATFQNHETSEDEYTRCNNENVKLKIVESALESKDFTKYRLEAEDIKKIGKIIYDIGVKFFSTEKSQQADRKVEQQIRKEFSKKLQNNKKFQYTGEQENIFDTIVKRIINAEFFKELFFHGIFLKTENTTGRKRYRLIPRKTEERKTEKKINWPTYYLGLSRLFPVGEAESANEKKIDNKIMDKILQKHEEILNSKDAGKEAKGLSVSDVQKKRGFGVETENYGSISNSSGQDNLGQILLTIESFRELKKKQGSKYIGGIFLIDEIDATLHPSAQNKLFDYLYKEARELNLQIVFTSHSLSLIEHIIKTGNLSDENDKIKLIYFTNSRGKLETKVNPELIYVRNDMLLTYGKMASNYRVDVFTEDRVAQWYLTQLLSLRENTINLRKLNVEMGWEQLINLFKTDYQYFQSKLLILDPDVKKPENKEKIDEDIRKTRYKFDEESEEHMSTIITLPGNESIEKLLWDFLERLPEDHRFYYDPEAEALGLDKRSIIANGPFQEAKYKGVKDLRKIKRWFEDNFDIIEILFPYWAKEHEEEIGDFLNRLSHEYEKKLKLAKKSF